MDGLAEATRGMKLWDKDAVFEQGRKAFRFGMELKNNPFQADTPHEVWAKGWHHARVEWENLLFRFKAIERGRHA